jgi:hypothetical protein
LPDGIPDLSPTERAAFAAWLTTTGGDGARAITAQLAGAGQLAARITTWRTGNHDADTAQRKRLLARIASPQPPQALGDDVPREILWTRVYLDAIANHLDRPHAHAAACHALGISPAEPGRAPPPRPPNTPR